MSWKSKSHVLWVSGSVRHVSHGCDSHLLKSFTAPCHSAEDTLYLHISGAVEILIRDCHVRLHDSVNRVSVMPVHVWHVINTKCSSIEPFPAFRYNTMYFMKRLLVYNSIYIYMFVSDAEKCASWNSGFSFSPEFSVQCIKLCYY